MTYQDNHLIQKIVNFIRQEIVAKADAPAISADDDLLDNSTIDSLAIMRLVAFLEQEFQIAIPASEITVENFQTVRVISDYLQSKLVEHADE